MNVQTERIDNHKAQFTVEIDADQLNDAKKRAAKRLAGQVRIKGFRKGKAPYNIIAQYVGEPAILEEAVELLGNDVYKKALDESQVKPYGPGSLDNFKLEPTPTFIFTVPLQPEVQLGDYRNIRLDFEEPEVTESDLDAEMEQLRQQHADVQDSEEPIVEGNRIVVDIHSEFIDGEENEDDDDESEDDDEGEDHDHDHEEHDHDHDHDHDHEDDEDYVPLKGDNFLHRHDAKIHLVKDKEPIIPGFVDALVGANAGEDVEFELTIPEDNEDYRNIAGRKVQFHVTINKVENISLPELNDEFAAKVTVDDDEPLNLEQLRSRTRENLAKEAKNRATAAYGDEILTEVVDGATISFPQMMVDERIEDMLKDLDNNMKQQGISLEDYMKVTGTTKESLQAQYQDSAVQSVERMLVLRELLTAENIEIDVEVIEERIDDMLLQFGAQGAALRQLIDTPRMRDNILNDLLMDNVMTRLVAIGQGKDPEEAIKAKEDEREAERAEAKAKLEAAQKALAEAQAKAEEESDETDTEESSDVVAEVISEEVAVSDSQAETDEADED